MSGYRWDATSTQIQSSSTNNMNKILRSREQGPALTTNVFDHRQRKQILYDIEGHTFQDFVLLDKFHVIAYESLSTSHGFFLAGELLHCD